MGRQDTKEEMKRVYREFSRQKYNKYKHQYPRWRESQVVAKIIREWQALDTEAKEKLQKIYYEHKFLTVEEVSESDKIRSGSKHDEDKDQVTSKKPIVPILEKSEVKENSESEFNRVSDQVVESIVDSESEKRSDLLKKSKKIRKQARKNSQYTDFYKSYYGKLLREHPRWTRNQITQIIRLLWRKKRLGDKNRKVKPSYKSPSLKKFILLSGFRFFSKRMLKQTEDKKEIRQLWKKKPREGRRLLEKEARQSAGLAEEPKTTSFTLKLKGHTSHESPIQGSLNFLRKPIKQH